MNEEYKIIESYLDPNPYSRPQSKILGLKGIVIHWVANPGSTAINNRNYFNNLKKQTGDSKRYASAHEIIGLDGEVVICIPKDEVAYHVGAKSYTTRAKQLFGNNPNRYLYGIEVCHPDTTGKFSDTSYKTLVNRVADLLIEFNLVPSKDTIWRHYDVTGKDCPHYYVQHPSDWDKLVNDITRKYYEKINKKAEEVIKMALEKWQEDMGIKSIDSLTKKGIVNNPEDWKKKFAEPVPQWLFWTIIDRVTKEDK